jgi:hypothetical protein
VIRSLLATLCGLLAALALVALAFAAPASAGWFAAEPVDGPSADILALGDVDLARDGTGALVYLKREGGVAHVFVSRFHGGSWHAPERVDVGLDAAAAEAVVAAADGARVAVAFASGGRVYGVLLAGATAAPTAPALLHAPEDPAQTAESLSADMGINGTFYVAFTAPGAGGADVRVARLQDATWEAVPAALDIDVAQAAGEGSHRPRVAVSAEGNAVVVWAEARADGRSRVFGRRVTGLSPSAAPQEISLPDAAAGAADSPDVDVEDDGSFAWAVWRQDVGGVSRALARRLVGSQFEAPAVVDARPGAISPRVRMSGRGVGQAVVGQADGAVAGSRLLRDAFAPGAALTGGEAPVVAVAERGDAALAWRRADGLLYGRLRLPQETAGFGPEQTLTPAELGVVPAGQYAIASDRVGDFAVATLQDGGGQRRITVASYDRPPAAPVGFTTGNYQRTSRPLLRWRPGAELWGTVTYRVFVDGIEIGSTTADRLRAPAPLPEGPHRWRILATDRRGQSTLSGQRYVRLDMAPPRVSVRVRGTRKVRRIIRVTVTALDGGSGIAAVSVDFGERSRVATRTRASYRYRKAGRHRIAVRVSDRAGNVTRQTVQLRIRR